MLASAWRIRIPPAPMNGLYLLHMAHYQVIITITSELYFCTSVPQYLSLYFWENTKDKKIKIRFKLNSLISYYDSGSDGI